MRLTASLASWAVLLLASPAPAQVHVRAPGVAVDVGPNGIFVGVGGFTLNLPGRPRMLETRPPRRALPPAPRRMPRDDETFDYVPGGKPPPVPLPPPRALVEDDGPEQLSRAPEPKRPPTPAEFAAVFEPAPGLHEVVLTHPTTRRPVNVRFRLPAGEPGNVRVKRDVITFEYVDRSVEVRFTKDGRVHVNHKK